MKVRYAERKGKSQNKPRFPAWITSFKSGKRKESFYIIIQINFPMSASTLKHSSLFISHLRIFQTQEDCTLNTYLKQHSCEIHPRAFLRYILKLHFSAMHLGKLYKQKSIQIQSLGKRERLQRNYFTQSKTQPFAEKSIIQFWAPTTILHKGNTVQCLI